MVYLSSYINGKVIFDTMTPMNFKNKKAIFFDLDGTLIDSAPDLANSINYMLTQLNLPTKDVDIVRKWVGNGAQTLVKRALSSNVQIDPNLDNELFEKAFPIFMEHYKDNICVNTHLYEHVHHTLKKLYESGYILTIITNKPYEFIEPIINTLEIEKYIRLYIGANSVEKKKPDPMPLLYTVSQLDLDINDCVMVGDSKNDIIAAQNANIHSIAVTYGYNYNEDITLYKPDRVIDSFEKLLEIF